MKKILVILLFIISLPQFHQAEGGNVAFRLSNFPGEGKGFRTAMKNLRKGYFHFERRYFGEALPFLLKAYDFNPNNVKLDYRIAFSLIKTNKGKLALKFLQKAQSLSAAQLPEGFNYALGLAYQYNEQWDKAIESYNAQRNAIDNKLKEKVKQHWNDLLDKKIAQCKHGKTCIENVKINIQNLEPISTGFDEYAPIITNGQKMYFTVRKPFKGAKTDPDDRKYVESVYFSEYETGTWSEPIKMKFNDLDGHTAIAGTSGDGETLLIYMDGDIFSCKKKKDRWSLPKPININTKYKETSAWIDPLREVLYFTSDRPGGKGGLDIYFSLLNNEGKWGTPKNLSNINTPYDEEGIYVTGDTLYFASKGHQSIGGYDIFKSIMVNAFWEKPIHLEKPVNSVYDDIYYINNGKRFHFASNRAGDDGFNIFKGEIAEHDKTTTQPVEELSTKKDSSGMDTVIAQNLQEPTGEKTGKDVEADDHLFHNENIDVEDEKKSKENRNLTSIGKKLPKNIAWYKVQVGAYHKVKTLQEFLSHFSFGNYNAVMEKHGNLYKFLIDKTFYPGKELYNNTDKALIQAAKLQKQCRQEFGIYDAFINAYNAEGKRVAIIKNVENMDFDILNP